jgi:predicted amidohydrolase
MQRRSFLSAAAAAGWPVQAAGGRESRSGPPPRKVIVGTVMRAFWGEYPGLEKRLEELAAIVDRMGAESERKYGRGLDLAVLPEAAVTGETGRDSLSKSVPFAGPLSRVFTSKARERRCYIVVPTYLREADDDRRSSNAALLVGRKGELAGIYRKVHLVVSADGKTMEGGATPGKDFPVFDCDFGKLGIQICYDMEFDHGWRELERKGAELVAWPTQSPQTAHPAFRAFEQRCYIVSSTWRNNASIFEPTGKIAAQIRPPESILVQELDLSYAILPWSSKLRNGKAFQERYGEAAGYRYYEDEDCGIFWSNDPRQPIGEMVRKLGLTEAEEELTRVRQVYHRAGVPGY